jgi:hypothetical protein
MSLIHDVRYFAKEEILDRARKYEFPNPLAVEIFLWDCELATQFQNVCGDILLRGGAAAQLHLPLEKQRGSIDIDIGAPLNQSEMKDVVGKVRESIGEFVKFKLHKPKKPIPKLPLMTYFAKMPTVLDLRRRRELEIKIDILLERLDLPTVLLENVQTFAVDVKRMRCLTVGALIGDKLLTLAKGSVGMELESDYPKQVYDIDALLKSAEISGQVVSEMVTSIKKLTELEAGYRNLKITPGEALRDVIATMDGYSLVDTSGGDLGIKKNIRGFQQFFVNQSQRSPFYGWSSKSLKIRFLATLIGEHIENRLSENDVARAITQSENIALRLDKVSGRAVIELRKRLLDLAETKIPYFKEMKGKPLGRVFWQIVTPRNLQDVESLV